MKTAYVFVLIAVTGCAADPMPIDPTDDDPSEFVATPNGFYHRDCVIDVGDNASIDNDSVTLADGSRMAIPTCQHAHYATRAQIGQVQPQFECGNSGEPVCGWKAWVQKNAQVWWKEVSASWSVPPEPTHFEAGDDTVYLFPDLQNSFTIVQPVLQYGPSPAGGSAFWSIGAWDCENAPGTCMHSTLSIVYVGHKLSGYANGTSCTSAGVCTWSIRIQDNSAPGVVQTFTHHEAAKMTRADVALETYDIGQCADLPASGAEAFSVTLIGSSGKTSTAGWVAHKGPYATGCNEHASSVGNSHAYLYWND